MALMPDPKSPLLHTSRHLKVSRSFQKPTATQAVPERFLDPHTLLQNSIRTTIHCIDSFRPGSWHRTLTLLASNLRWQAGTHNSGAILHTEWRKSESSCRTHAMRRAGTSPAVTAPTSTESAPLSGKPRHEVTWNFGAEIMQHLHTKNVRKWFK